jgi:hypothetical protein
MSKFKIRKFKYLGFGFDLKFDAAVQSQTMASDELWHLTFSFLNLFVLQSL